MIEEMAHILNVWSHRSIPFFHPISSFFKFHCKITWYQSLVEQFSESTKRSFWTGTLRLWGPLHDLEISSLCILKILVFEKAQDSCSELWIWKSGTFFFLCRENSSVHSCYSAWKACIRLRPIITSIFFLNIIGTFLAFLKATGIIALLHLSNHNIFFSTQF